MRTTPTSSTATADGGTGQTQGQGGGFVMRDLRRRARRARADPASGAAQRSIDEAGRRWRRHGARASSCSFLGRRERGHRERERGENRRKRGAGRGRSWGRGRRLACSPGRHGDEGLVLLDESTLGPREPRGEGVEASVAGGGFMHSRSSSPRALGCEGIGSRLPVGVMHNTREVGWRYGWMDLMGGG